MPLWMFIAVSLAGQLMPEGVTGEQKYHCRVCGQSWSLLEPLSDQDKEILGLRPKRSG